MHARYFLVQTLGQNKDAVVVLLRVAVQLNLSHNLTGKAVRHHEAWMASCASQIHQAPLGQNNDASATRERNLVNLRLDLIPYVLLDLLDLNFAIEMTNIADDGHILHLPHMCRCNDVAVTRCGHKDVTQFTGLLHRDDLVALHCSLQRTDRVNFSHQHT